MAEPNRKRRFSDEGVAQDTDVKMEEPTKVETKTSTAAKPNNTLFVRSLPATATKDSLAEFFSQSYVLKHAVTVNNSEKQCKGYGFVTFADLEDAQSALEELNGADFEGKKIRVEYAQQRHREIDEKLGKSKPAAKSQQIKQDREDEHAANQPPKLIIRNLPWSIKTIEDLAALFRSYGKVKWADLPKQNNKLRGFGFVILRGKKNAEKALQGVNGKEIDGRTLAVDWAVDREQWENVKKDDADEEKESKEDEDVDMEDKAAKEDDDETSSDEDDDEEDEEEDEDDEDLDDLEDLDEEARKEPIEDDRNECTVFLRNLPFTCTNDTLYEHFTQFGPLRYARIVLDRETERPRGTGFVCFWKVEDCMTCVREAPKPDTVVAEKERSKPAMKHSILQHENSDPTGRYTLDGRILQVARAVNKNEAAKLNEEGVSRRLVRDKDKRRLYLLSEGTIPSNSPLYKKLSPSEIKMREESYKQREGFIKKNPALHLSLTRLSIRNLPRHITSKDLKQLAREAVVGFAKDVKAEKRQSLSREEQQRSRETMKELEHERKEKKAGIVRQAKIVFETREGTKVPEKEGGGRSRGYGFIEYYTHRHALMGLRWLNCHPIEIPANSDSEEKDKRKRLVVEFAIENAQVIKRRQELQDKKKQQAKEKAEKDAKGEQEEEKGQKGQKRKRSEKGKDSKEDGEDVEEDKVAKRNRIIGKKRAQRKARKA